MAAAKSKRKPAPNRRITPAKLRKFLEHVRLGWGPVGSARECGISKQSFYRYRDLHPEFARAWDDAVADFRESLEREIARRGIHGVDKPVFYKGKKVGDVRSYSDVLLIFRAKAEMPEKYRDVQQVEMTGKDGGPIELAQIEGARERLVAKLAPVVDIRRAAGLARADSDGAA